MRLFGSERVHGHDGTPGRGRGHPHRRRRCSPDAIENAQKKVESRNFQTRKNVLQYDDVMNTQRKVIYEQRQKVLDGEDLQESLHTMRRNVFTSDIHSVMGEKGYLEDREELQEILKNMEGLYFPKGAYNPSDEELSSLTADTLLEKLMTLADQVYAVKEAAYGSPLMREAERVITLRVVDEYWMDQIDAMQDLRQGIVLRAYGQNDPLVEYKREGYAMFEAMNRSIQEETTRRSVPVPDSAERAFEAREGGKGHRRRGRRRQVRQKGTHEEESQGWPERSLPLRFR